MKSPEMVGISPENDKDMPSLAYVQNQITAIGGEVLLLGLTRKQADVLIKLAKDNGLEMSETKLADHEMEPLSKKFQNVTPESVTLYLGHTVNCEQALYSLLESK